VTSIGDYAFYRCDSLEKVNITDLKAWCNISFGDMSANPLYYAGNLYLNGEFVTNLVIPEGVTEIKDYAFRNCCWLVSATIPDSVTSIGDYAFSHCYSLVSITIPDSVTSIGECAFSNCDSLASITIPDSVTSIGDTAFYSCNSLKSVSVGNGITTIPQNAFYSCSNLKYVSLPEELLYIRKDAFYGSSVDTVFYAGSESQWSNVLLYSGNDSIANANIIYNAVKKTFSFVTNCEAQLPDIYDYAVFTSPTVENEDVTFIGWFDNEELSGSPVTFPYYGSATTLYAAWTEKTGASFDDAFTAKINQQYTVAPAGSGQLVYYKFVAPSDGQYKFYTTGSKDTMGYLYSSSKSQLKSDDDSGDGSNFMISYKLTGGQTYYIATKLYSGSGEFTLVTEKVVEYIINSITVKDSSGNTLDQIPKGEFLATVSITNNCSDNNTMVVLGQYTQKGAFRGLMYVATEDVPVGATMKLTLPVDNSGGDVVILKAFLIESFDSVMPMGAYVSFPAQ